MHLIIFRFLAAIGMGGEWGLGVALIMECWPEKYRPGLAGLIGAAANVGFLLISLVAVRFAVDEHTWRYMMLGCAAPAILCFFILALIPRVGTLESIGQDRIVETASRDLRHEPHQAGLAWNRLLVGGADRKRGEPISAFLPLWTDQIVGGDRILKITANIRADATEAMTPGTV